MQPDDKTELVAQRIANGAGAFELELTLQKAHGGDPTAARYLLDMAAQLLACATLHPTAPVRQPPPMPAALLDYLLLGLQRIVGGESADHALLLAKSSRPHQVAPAHRKRIAGEVWQLMEGGMSRTKASRLVLKNMQTAKQTLRLASHAPLDAKVIASYFDEFREVFDGKVGRVRHRIKR